MAMIRIGWLALAGLTLGVARAPAEEPWHIETQERLVAVSDIHGAYDEFVAILRKAGLIDAQLEWIGGPARLVVVGDVLDRGDRSREALDLIMELQSQARAQGGDVLFVLGNHEVMNIVGDLRYVPPAEYSTFADTETSEARRRAFEQFLAATGEPRDAAAQAEFDRRYPVGFFAQRRAFSSEGVYGAWLLEQPVLLIANDTAFAHAGLSHAYVGVDPAEINTELKRQLREYAAAMEALIEAGVLSPADDFYDHPVVIDRYAARVAAGETTWSAEIEALAGRLKELNEAPIFALASPTWYRGMVSCSPLVERDDWAQTLARLGVERIVVGHTPTPDARVLSRMEGGIVRIDTGMLGSYYGGRPAALSITDGEPEVLYADSTAPALPLPQPRRVGGRPGNLTDDAIEALLSEGTVSERREVDGRLRVTLRDGDVVLDANFYPADRGDLRPEVATYRLDRLLGLDMVPVTVPREIDGMAGALELAPANLITETERSQTGAGGAAWCPLRQQFPAMYVFDTIIYNEGRGTEQIAYERESFQLVLLGHEQTFGTQRGRPAHLREATLELSDAWIEALSALDEDRLTEALGDVLSRRQIRAVTRRIEEVLEDADAG